MTPKLAHTDWWKPGYADIVIQDPDDLLDVCDADGCKTNYLAKPTPNGWMIITWATWGVEEFDE